MINTFTDTNAIRWTRHLRGRVFGALALVFLSVGAVTATSVSARVGPVSYGVIQDCRPSASGENRAARDRAACQSGVIPSDLNSAASQGRQGLAGNDGAPGPPRPRWH